MIFEKFFTKKVFIKLVNIFGVVNISTHSYDNDTYKIILITDNK